MEEDKNTTSEVDIHLRFNKERLKTCLTLAGGLSIIFCLTTSKELRIGLVILGLLCLAGILPKSETVYTEDKKNEDVPNDNSQPVEKSSSKEIRKPKMPVKEEQSEPKKPTITTKEEDMNKDDWDDFFSSLDDDEKGGL